MPAREASAQWSGALADGRGEMSFGSGAWQGAYSFSSRFEEGSGTNPEELIAAAHAGCFSMSLAHELSEAGHVPTSVDTTATVTLSKAEDGWAISRVDLVTEADVEGVDEADFQSIAEGAKAGCPVSKALAALEITLQATLRS